MDKLIISNIGTNVGFRLILTQSQIYQVSQITPHASVEIFYQNFGWGVNCDKCVDIIKIFLTLCNFYLIALLELFNLPDNWGVYFK